MNFEDFKKYKEISEARNLDFLDAEGIEVYSWMEKTGRIDEGLFGSIWKWLKRNFSPTASKINKLANQYGNELEKEMEAEFGKIKNSKDKASRMRASWAGRISGDIEERMRIEADDDEDYQELVRHLLNKKTLEAKRKILNSLEGIIDEDDWEELDKETKSGLEKENKKGKEVFNKLAGKEKEAAQQMEKDLMKLIQSEKRDFSAFLKDQTSINDFIQTIISYLKKLSEKGGKFSFTSKDAQSLGKTFLKIVKEGASMLSKYKSYEVAASEVYKALIISMNKVLDKNPVELESLKRDVFEKAKEKLKKKSDLEDSEEKAKEETTTELTDEIIDDEEVDDGIEKAAEETDEDEPSAEDIVKEVESYLTSYFSKNISRFTSKLNSSIKKFNSATPEKRKELAKDYEYDLESDGSLKEVKENEVKLLINRFVDIAGSIVTYYQKKEDAPVVASRTVLRFIFEIYALQKGSGKLTPEQKEQVIENLKQKYPDDFK